MKKIYMLLLTVLFAAQINAQNVNVSGALVGNGTYPDLGAAFTAINGGAQTGASIVVSVTGNTTEAVSAVLNAGVWSTLTISPSGGATRTISGSIVGQLIDLNGASNVTINGLNASGNALTISNAALGAASTIRFIADASNNTVTNCTLEGSATASFGVVHFSTGTITGNDGNVISNNNIGPAGANFPLNGIHSLGTSAAIDNSGNTVTGNNIADVFLASSFFNGININSFNSGWTITNNKIYQTAARTVTTANTSQGIFISSGNGYTITGNVIGYASSSATGTMVLNSTVALRYTAIHGAFTAGGTANSIQNNTVASISLTTSSGATTTNGILCGINVTSGDANIGTVTGNTIGATTGTGSLLATSTTSGGLIVGINSSSTGTISIQNNTIGALASSGVTASVAGSISGIIVSGAAASMTISNNTIGNATADNMRGGTLGLTTSSSLVSGINMPSTPTVATVTNNTIQNLSSYGTGTSGFVRGIWTALSSTATATGWSISNNTINNLTTNNATTSISSGVCSALGIHHLSSQGCLISGNSISNISNINTTATTNIIVAGIMSANASVTTTLGTEITRNKIWNLSNTTVGTTALTPPMVVGIGVRSGNNVTAINNNMISLGAGQTTNTSFIGIWNNNGSTPNPSSTNVYHNSVNIEGAAAAGALPSFAYLRAQYISATSNTVTVDVKNNILQNNRTGGTGQHFAISNGFNSTTVSATGWAANASNFNILNANAAAVGHWTSAQTFAGWQTASISDANSISGVTPNFVNTATADLHITTPYPSVVEGAGTNIASVTVDYDGQTRSGLSPVDIGADAGNFLNSPGIAITPLNNTCATTARTLSATITDPDGVPTSGAGLPVLYWRINAGAYTPATATFVSGSQYDFTFGAGAVIGDAISYYIVAQDNVGNVGSSPALGAGGFTINPPAAATPPTTPYSYAINPTLSGTYTVGVGGNFTTLTAAAAAYSTNCLGGPVVFSLTDATYPSETFPIVFNSNPDASATNTLTIKPTGTTTISGSTTSTIIQINGGDYITIDGSNSSTANSICPLSTASRNLTIQNTNTTAFTAVVWFNTVTSPAVNGVTNCTIKNCIVIGGSNVNTAAGIGIGALPLISGGIDNDFNRIENNEIRLCRFGIYVVGQSAANKNEGNVINQNILTAVSPNNIGEGGIFSANENNLTVSGNEVGNISQPGSPDVYGINLGFGITGGFAATTIGIANTIGNATITNNKIGTITNTGTFSAIGLAMSNTVAGSTQLIANNTISGVAANGTAGDFAAGLWLNGGTGTTNIYNNTVVMQGTQSGATSGTQTSTAFGVITLSSALDVKNNIFVNKQGGGVAGTTTRYAAVALGYAFPYTGFISNNNNLFSAGAGPGTYTTGITGGVVAGTSRLTLADWQTETAQDAASKNINPVFVSATDLHLQTTPLGTNWCLNSSGASVAGVTNDIDCQVRNNPPDIGADEFTPLGDAVATPASQTICTGTAITTIALTGTATSFNWTRDNTATVTGIAASGTGDISGTLTNTTASPVTVTFTITPVDAVGCFGPSITATVTVNPNNTIALTSAGGTDAQTVCINTAITDITYATTGATGATVTGLPTGVTGTWAANVVTISGTPTTTVGSPFNYTVTLTGGCGTITANGTITVIPDNTITLTSAGGTDAQTVCINTAITDITYATTGAMGATVTGLPTGVTGTWLANVVTISGTPTTAVGSPFNYTVTLTGGCGTVTATGTITVNPNNTIALTSAPGTNAQTACINSPITNITYSTTGATGATVTGLPTGVTGTWLANVVTISGTPTTTVGSPFNYTVTLTGGCGTVTATGTITVNPTPTISSSQVEPTTCASADGSITLTLGGAAGPYTFAWTGAGVSPASQNQTGLTVGAYSVTVTAANGCTATANFALSGPGGCSICPTIPTFTTTPSVSACTGNNVTLSASGLTSMGSTYGIIFKYSTTALADPYTGGTVIATVANGALTSGGTVATANTSTIPAGNYIVYAVLTPTPVDPACRPAVQVNLTIGTTPDVNSVSNQIVCNGASTTAVNFTGTVPGTVFNWTNSDASIGLAASGSGNIGSFTATNTGTTPVVATVTVTPTFTSLGACNPGPIQTFSNSTPTTIPTGPAVVTSTISVSGAPTYLTELSVITNIAHTFAADLDITITSPAGTVVTLTTDNGAGNDNVFNGTLWRDKANPGGTLPYNTNNGMVTDNAYVNLTTATPLAPEEPLGAFIGENPNGIWTITISDDLAGDGGSLDSWALNLEGLSSAPTITTTSVTQSTPLAIPTGPAVVTSTLVVAGAGTILHDVNLTTFLTHTFAADLDITITSPAGTVVTLTSDNGAGNDDVFNGTVWNDNANPGGTLPYNSNNGMVTDNLYVNLTLASPLTPEEPLAAFRGENPNGTWTITVSDDLAGDGGSLNSWTLDLQTANCPITCTGTPITYTYTVNPTPTATATPASQTICSGATITTVALTGAVSGTTYNWTRDNTATVTGIAASGSGDISGILTNTTAAPITVTFTITPSANGCPGSAITATVLVNPTPTAVATPASQTICSGNAITTVVLTGAVSGTTYNWTRDNTATVTGIAASGAGDISGTLTNTTAAPVTVTFTITPVANGCTGTAIIATVLVNPTPTAVSTPASQTVCSGLPITTIVLTGAVSGTTYNWTRDNTATVTGIAASGFGDISGTLTNTTAAPVTVTFTITPVANGCTGTAITATVLVNPTPNAIATPASQTVCTGVAITPIVLTSGVAGTTYTWTRDNTATVTGIAASGSGNISGTLTNTTFAPVTVTFTITPSANGCTGTAITATVLVNPLANVIATPAAQTICNGVTITPIVLTSGTPGATFTWTRNNTSTTTAPGGIPASGSGSTISGFMINTTNAPITVTFTITASSPSGCGGTTTTATVTIQPTTTAIATPAFQVSCSGSPITTINLTSPVAGTVYRWTRDNVVAATGIAANGTGNISGTLTTTATTPVTVTFTIIPSINGCDGPAIIATDTVRPTPSVNTPANQTVCNGAATTAVTFTSPVAGTVFNWTNNTPSIGLAASGTGNIASFTATNTTNAPVTATITVTPVAAGCPGTAITFTITVNPTAVVNTVANQTLCAGQSTTAITFSSPTTGTVTYSWTNNTPSIGLAASGTGNIPSFVAVNNTPTAVTATITVTPNSAAGCVGVARTFTITVNGFSVAPTAAVSSVTANCGPTTTTLSVQGGALGTGATWRWYTGSCGGTAIGTGASITVPINATTTYFVRAEGTCNTTACASVTVVINTVPTISIAAAPYTALTPLLTTNLTATVTPVQAGNVIEWFKNNGIAPVATGATLSNITVDQLGSYQARITTAQGCTATSNIVVLRDSVTSQLFVYPNPNNGQFKIRYYIPDPVISVVRRVVIYDSKGAMVYNKPLSVQTRWGALDINIRGVAQGDYFIKLLDVAEREIVGARVAVLR